MWQIHLFYGEIFRNYVEVKKVDSQGRIVLPSDWREAEIGESRELYVIKRKGYLKMVPKRTFNLTCEFNNVDLGVEAIGSWEEFEKNFMRRAHEVP